TTLTRLAPNPYHFIYSSNFSHQQQYSEATAGGNLIWRAPVATIGGSYSQSKKYQQISGNIQGGLVAWSDGIALAPRLSDTFTIVHAPG
ncbi:fimbria/pilus outer membrane usher protein, partial [Escherichia coli]|nr:fimbria/pilus outer membrane usher protein [Escherichia coli]